MIKGWQGVLKTPVFTHKKTKISPPNFPGQRSLQMNNIIRRVCFSLAVAVFSLGLSTSTATAATRLTPAHLYNWARTGNTPRLQQFKRYINLQDRNQNTALCLAQPAQDRNAEALSADEAASLLPVSGTTGSRCAFGSFGWFPYVYCIRFLPVCQCLPVTEGLPPPAAPAVRPGPAHRQPPPAR